MQFCEWLILKSYIQTIKPSPLYLTVKDSEKQTVGREVKDRQKMSQFLIPIQSIQRNSHQALIENLKKTLIGNLSSFFFTYTNSC